MSFTRITPDLKLHVANIAAIKAAVPEAFADGSINWDVLREALDDQLESTTEQSEHFGLFWPGKRDARRLAAVPSRGTLVPAPGRGLSEASTKNIFVEGENLEVLKLVQKAYAGRVKMIYIDPPYNTGNDFVYSDDFADPLGDYLRKTGQADEAGLLTSNTRADGRFHSNWLTMVYPRLKLARDLLAEDGILFVSIDDNEMFNLRQVLNELFGEENFLENFIWKKSYGGGAKEKYVVRQHEYVLAFARDRDALPSLWLPTNQKVVERYYKFRDEKFESRGPYRLQPLEAAKSMDARPNLVYPIPSPDGKEVWPKRQWLWKRERALEALHANELVFSSNANSYTVAYKQYLKDDTGEERGAKPTSILDGPYTQEGTRDLSVLFEGKIPLQFPKPVGLLKTLIQIGTDSDAGHLVIDFFAGSGTTAQAVMELNREDSGDRRFFLVQLPEPTGSGTQTGADLCIERIKRASRELRKAANASPKEDLGVRVFKLVESNFRPWKDYTGQSLEQLQMLFDQAEERLIDGWSAEAVLTEVMLLEGFPLDSVVAELPSIRGANVRLVTSTASDFRLAVCLDRNLDRLKPDELPLNSEDIFICLDSALSDQMKLRLAERFHLKTI